MRNKNQETRKTTMEIPFDDLDPEASGGFDSVAPGWMHAEVLNVSEGTGHSGSTVVDLECLRHSVAGQEGKSHRELFWVDFSKKQSREKFMALALATGLTTVEEVKALAAQGKSPNIDYTKAIGKQVVVKMGMYKERVNINFDNIYHPSNSKADNCPLHAVKIAAAGIVLPPGRHIDGAVVAAKASVPSAPNPNTQKASIDSLMKGL